MEIDFLDLVKSITIGGVTTPIEEVKEYIRNKEVQNGNKDMC
jgi:hypothetical protein